MTWRLLPISALVWVRSVYRIQSRQCPCVGEWNKRPQWSSVFIHGRQLASSLIITRWRWRVGRWLLQSSHSTAEQSTTTARRHRWQLWEFWPHRYVGAKAIMLQCAHVRGLRSTQQRGVVDAVWPHFGTHSTLSERQRPTGSSIRWCLNEFAAKAMRIQVVRPSVIG